MTSSQAHDPITPMSASTPRVSQPTHSLSSKHRKQHFLDTYSCLNISPCRALLNQLCRCHCGLKGSEHQLLGGEGGGRG